MAAVKLDELMKLFAERLENPCTDDHIATIAVDLTSWKVIATHLGLNEAEIEAIDCDAKCIGEKRLKALQKWKNKFAYEATYKKLVHVFQKVGNAEFAIKVCNLLADGQLVPEILCTHPEATAAAVMISPFPVVDQHDLQRLTVEYQRNDEQEWEVVEAKQSEETLTISITGLLSSTQYKVKTVAHYPDRNVPSEPKQFTTLDMSESPSDLVTRFKLSADRLNEQCKEEHLEALAIYPPKWEMLNPELGLDRVDLKISLLYAMSSEEIHLEILKRWRYKFADEATYMKLIEVYLKIGNADLASRVCELLTFGTGSISTLSTNPEDPIGPSGQSSHFSGWDTSIDTGDFTAESAEEPPCSRHEHDGQVSTSASACATADTSTVQFMWQPLTEMAYPKINLLASFECGSVELSLDRESSYYTSDHVTIKKGTYEGQLEIGDSFISPVKNFTIEKDFDTVILQFEDSRDCTTMEEGFLDPIPSYGRMSVKNTNLLGQNTSADTQQTSHFTSSGLDEAMQHHGTAWPCIIPRAPTITKETLQGSEDLQSEDYLPEYHEHSNYALIVSNPLTDQPPEHETSTPPSTSLIIPAPPDYESHNLSLSSDALAVTLENTGSNESRQLLEQNGSHILTRIGRLSQFIKKKWLRVVLALLFITHVVLVLSTGITVLVKGENLGVNSTSNESCRTSGGLLRLTTSHNVIGTLMVIMGCIHVIAVVMELYVYSSGMADDVAKFKGFIITWAGIYVFSVFLLLGMILFMIIAGTADASKSDFCMEIQIINNHLASVGWIDFFLVLVGSLILNYVIVEK